MIELTKSQKKTARKLINLGLQRECAKFMQSTKDFMNKNASAEDAHDAYLKLYDKVYQFDKHIARRYDGMSGGRYYITVCYLYYDGVLTDEDIREFDDELYNSLKELFQILVLFRILFQHQILSLALTPLLHQIQFHLLPPR